MANYNVGDMVILKGKDELKKIVWVTDSMLTWADGRAMITKSDNENDIYTLDMSEDYMWGRSCFKGEPMNDDDLREEYRDDHEDDDIPNTKFKVGDRVRVKKGIEERCGVPYEMVKMAGKTATVAEIANESTGSCFLEFDDKYAHNGFIWFTDLLEHIEDDDTPITPTMSSNESKTVNIAKNKYDVGDYVRIVDINELKRLADEDDEAPSGVVDDMFDYASKLARITDIEYDADNYWKYTIDLDNGEWRWNESMFEYRLGNYDDNTKGDFIYVIGYKTNKDSVKINKFNGLIENFAPCGKSVFVDENGKTLVLPWELIEYIMPIDD